MRSKILYIIIILAEIISCTPRHGDTMPIDNDSKKDPGDKYFECWPQIITIKPQGIMVDTIRTFIPAFLAGVQYNISPKVSKCEITDNLYTDERICIERISKMRFKLEYISDDFSEESIDLYFRPLEDPTYTHGLVQIYISLDY